MLHLFRRPGADTIGTLYGAIVAQARQPAFYADYGVPDTLDGRFDMIVLHVALFFRRVRSESEPLRGLGQGVFDRFCRDMDDNLRELGVTDLGVPRKMRSMAEAFYGRAAAYDAALDGGDQQAIEAALMRNIFAEAAGDGRRLALYAQAAADALGRQEGSEIAGGRLCFPDPAGVGAAAVDHPAPGRS